jgi:hypothetical protein
LAANVSSDSPWGKSVKIRMFRKLLTRNIHGLFSKLPESELPPRMERESSSLRLPRVPGGKLLNLGQDEESSEGMPALS